MKAILNRIRISPKKANLIAGIVRGEWAEKALETLKFMPKKGAELLYKVLHSAVANAENNFDQKRSELKIHRILITAWPTFKRGQSHSKGRITPLLKRTSNITIELEAIITDKTEEVKTEEVKTEEVKTKKVKSTNK